MIWIYIIYFGLWFFFLYHKKGLSISSLLVGLFFLGTVFCELIFTFYPETVKHPERISFGAIFFHILFLTLLLIPLVRYGDYIKISRINISENKLNKFSWWIIIPSLLYIIFTFSDVVRMFSVGNMLEARIMFVNGKIDSSMVSKFGSIGYFIGFARSISVIALVLSFYYIFYLKKRNYYGPLLFISSFAMPLFTLTVMGRDGVFRWFLFLLVAIILFKDYISFKAHRKFWISIISVTVCSFSIFFLITKDRFEKDSTGITYSVLRYLGEQYYLFSYGYERFGETPMKNSILSPFPIITQEKEEALFLNKRYHADYFLNTFATIAGSFENKIGTYKSVLLCLFLFSALFLIFWKKGNISFAKFIGYLFYYEIMLMGLFYYMHDDRYIQFTILFYIFLAYLYSKPHFKFKAIKA